ncbi:hypothetical protein [Streptomyces sp. NPDC097981]|uniref:hypothetical protein n=1 Tax=Streptomyces sp. NPDC097981 TaxID=3155428 RepID=UPI00331F88AF
MSSAVHLHVASGYSARYGAAHPRDLVHRAAERGIGMLALTTEVFGLSSGGDGS